MRVDLWSDGSVDEHGKRESLLVKVNYWWKKKDGVWLQILHDIVYMGPRDGTEGLRGEILD